MGVTSAEPLCPTQVRAFSLMHFHECTTTAGAVPAQCDPRREGPGGAACPALAPALVPFSKPQKSLLRIVTMVLFFSLSIHHWYLPSKRFSLNTFSTYQPEWSCALRTYTMKLERLSLVSGGGTERHRPPAPGAARARPGACSLWARAGRRPPGGALPAAPALGRPRPRPHRRGPAPIAEAPRSPGSLPGAGPGQRRPPSLAEALLAPPRPASGAGKAPVAAGAGPAALPLRGR